MNAVLNALKALPDAPAKAEAGAPPVEVAAPPGPSDAAGATANGTPPVLKKISYTHDAMIDLIIANPGLSQGQVAAAFGYTQTWISRIMSSDAFRERLEARRKAIVDPSLVLSIDEKLARLCHLSLDKIADKIEGGSASETLLLEGLEIASRAKGYGAKESGNGKGGATAAVQVVVQVPQKSASADDWQRNHSPNPLGDAITIEVKEPGK